MRHKKSVALILLGISLLYLSCPAPIIHADEALNVSGRLDLRGAVYQENDSVQEDPSLKGRIKLDSSVSSWRFHSWLEGGWDGMVKRPPRDH